ncbi:MAG: hypothetical protein IJX87_03955 [Clostridia bacterium]|nr:hypothetical protein [Clostridia bacterium]
MTEEIIKSITEAEGQAAEIRRVANERAEQIVAEAQMRAARSMQSSEEVSRAYKETQIKTAHKEAQNAYDTTIAEKTRAAQEYCAQVFKAGAPEVVGNIVGRITSGNC